MSSSVSTASSDRRPLQAAILLFVVALIVRLFGITWGLPNDLHNDSLHPDEAVVYSNYAYQNNPYMPGNYNYPSLYPLALRVAGDMAATYGGIDSPGGIPPAKSLDELKTRLVKFAPHQRATNLAGRVLNCVAGAATAVVVFFIALRFAGMAGALFGGAMTAFAPAFVVHSRFQTVDVFATFFFWLAILYAVKLYLNSAGEKLDLRYAILAGLFAGLSTGTKYTGIVTLISVIAALALKKHPKWAVLAGTSVGVCILTFVITTPGCIFDFSQFMFGVQAEAKHMREGHDLAFVHTPIGFVYQLGNLFTGIGPLAFLIGSFGLVYSAANGRKWMWVVLPAVLGYLLLIGFSQVKFMRYGLPLIPAICIGYGYAVAGALRNPSFKKAGMIFGFVSLLGLESLAFSGFKPAPYWACFDPRFGGVVGTVRYTQDMMREDPRETAARFVLNLTQTDPNPSIGIFRWPWFWTVPVFKDANFLYNVDTKDNKMATYTYFLSTKNPHIQFASWSPRAKYVVLSSFETAPFDRVENDDQVSKIWRPLYQEEHAILHDIRIEDTPVATFGGDAPIVEDLMYVQPKAYVFELK